MSTAVINEWVEGAFSYLTELEQSYSYFSPKECGWDERRYEEFCLQFSREWVVRILGEQILYEWPNAIDDDPLEWLKQKLLLAECAVSNDLDLLTSYIQLRTNDEELFYEIMDTMFN